MKRSGVSFRNRVTSSMVRFSGVATSSYFPSGKFGVFGTDSASSTFAAYPQASQSATSSSPAGEGAMYSCAMEPPIMPVSLWTT